MADVIRTLIVDDEPVARQGVRRLLESDAGIDIVGEAGNGVEAVRLILELRPDLLFLDIQMPELNGFEVIARVGVDAMPIVVFVTAHDAFALRAFEAQAFDYLLKPFDDDRFRTVLERARQQVRLTRDRGLDRRLESLLRQYADRGAPGAARIMVKDAGVVLFQPVDEIDWIEAADYFTKLHAGGKVHLVNETMTRLEQRLDPAVFMRVHRSAIVNLRRVRELRLDYGNRHVIVLTNGERVPLSRSRREPLEAALAGRSE
jgi:two-component system LytT family response regulator